MNQQAYSEKVSDNAAANILNYQPVPDALMTTLIGVYARLWNIERAHGETLQKENLMLSMRGLLVCIENYCLNGVMQHTQALRELVNRMKRLQDSLFFTSSRRGAEDMITIANTVAEAVRFAEASMPHLSVEVGDA